MAQAKRTRPAREAQLTALLEEEWRPEDLGRILGKQLDGEAFWELLKVRATSNGHVQKWDDLDTVRTWAQLYYQQDVVSRDEVFSSDEHIRRTDLDELRDELCRHDYVVAISNHKAAEQLRHEGFYVLEDGVEGVSDLLDNRGIDDELAEAVCRRLAGNGNRDEVEKFTEWLELYGFRLERR